jgi:hypothetical protein
MNKTAGTSMEEDRELLPSYTDHNGYRMPRGFPVEGFTSGLRYRAQPNDLFVATYPKCGTTWTQHIVYLILHDGRPLPPDQQLTVEFPHLEEVGAEFVSQKAVRAGRYRLIKTHLPHQLTPRHDEAKYICVVRNPKDCVVSFFHHTRGFPKHYHFANGSFETFFLLFIDGKVDFGDYFAHLRSWLEHKGDPNVLFLTYEDMRRDTRAAILKVATFLDPAVYPARLLANNEKMLQAVLHHSSLDSMKKDPGRWSSTRPAAHTPFIRKGSVGDWEELLTDQQATQLDRRMKETCSAEELEWLGDMYGSTERT